MLDQAVSNLQAARELRKSDEYKNAITKMVIAANKAGSPPDQIRNFALGGYTPTEEQWIFHSAARMADNRWGPSHIAMGGPRGGAKSHAIMCQAALDDCQRFPGLEILYLRLIQKAGRKALDQLRGKTIMALPHKYNRNEGLISFPNGSSIVVGHFKNEGDIDKYIGIEFDEMIVEERTQLSRQKIDQLFGSLRTGKDGWRPRSYNAANPGGLGHQEFRSDFILPAREGRQQQTKTFYMNADWRKNPFINLEYKEYLMGLTGILGEMWRDGNWDIGSGTYFINWLPEVHVIKPMKRIPLEWKMWVSLDWGWTHPFSVQWHTLRPDGAIVTVDEYKAQRTLVADVAEEIERRTRKWDRKMSDIVGWVAGHDIYANRGSHPDGLTIADQFSKHGIRWTRANVDRINGAAEMTRRLGSPRESKPTSWFVTENCQDLIYTMPNMIIDDRRPEDVLKVDANEFGEGGDDSYDCARYGIMVRPLYIHKSGFAWKY
jgi:hypothetical protein